MSYTYTIVPVGSDWTELSADITVTTAIQVKHRSSEGKPDLEIRAAAAEPAAADVGIDLLSGDALLSGAVADLGATGKVWGRKVRADLSGSAISVLVVTSA